MFAHTFTLDLGVYLNSLYSTFLFPQHIQYGFSLVLMMLCVCVCFFCVSGECCHLLCQCIHNGNIWLCGWFRMSFSISFALLFFCLMPTLFSLTITVTRLLQYIYTFYYHYFSAVKHTQKFFVYSLKLHFCFGTDNSGVSFFVLHFSAVRGGSIFSFFFVSFNYKILLRCKCVAGIWLTTKDLHKMLLLMLWRSEDSIRYL